MSHARARPATSYPHPGTRFGRRGHALIRSDVRLALALAVRRRFNGGVVTRLLRSRRSPLRYIVPTVMTWAPRTTRTDVREAVDEVSPDLGRLPGPPAPFFDSLLSALPASGRGSVSHG